MGAPLDSAKPVDATCENASTLEQANLEHSHAREDIAERLAQPPRQSYLKDSVYGGVDGAVTTFAVVSGVAGAGLSPSVVIILGIANLVGDGFSMAAGNFLGTRAENQQLEKLRQIEHKHIAQCPEGEREEIRQILRGQGFEGKLLEDAVDTITADEKRWVDMMLRSEYGVSTDRPNAVVAASFTFISFMIVGALPLIPFIYQWVSQQSFAAFAVSTVLTGVAFAVIGAVKARFVQQAWWRSAAETVAVGAAAAGLAYACGYALSGVA